MSDLSFEDKIEYLDKKLTEYLGSLGLKRNQKIIDHLIGTSEILKDMDAPSYLIDAGLFHSVYGEVASKLPPNSLIERSDLQEVIGIQAEEIVFLFCSIPQPRTKNIHSMEHGQLRNDLILLCQANDKEMGSPQ